MWSRRSLIEVPDDVPDQADKPDSEDVLATLLKVDPEGIIGKEGKGAREAERHES